MTEKIEVFYSRIAGVGGLLEGLFGPKYHKYLVYTDKTGEKYVLRAGPTDTQAAGSSDPLSPPNDPRSQTAYGPLAFNDGLLKDSRDAEGHEDSLGETLLEGEDLSAAISTTRSA